MSVDSDGVSGVKCRVKCPLPLQKMELNSLENSLPSSPSKRNKSQGIMVVGCWIYDPIKGKTCHQCRQKTRDFVAACKSLSNNKPCPIMFCYKCLLNRYGEKAEEVDALGGWSCPRCRGICNCSICREKGGHQPTSILITTAKATGYSSVSGMLLKGGETSNQGKINDTAMVVTPTKDDDASHLSREVHKDMKRPRMEETSSLADGMKLEKAKKINELEKDLYAEIPLPMGTKLKSVSKINIHTVDIGNALRFSEFCEVFGKILDVKKGYAEYVLQDLLHGRTGRRGKITATAQFHILLLSILNKEQQAGCENLSASWFHALKKYFSESRNVLKAPCLDALEKASDYETLNASEKLSLLNLLCDEVLATEKVRTWMEDQNSKHAEKIKEAKHKLAAARHTEKDLKQKLKDDLAKALSVSEHDAILAQIKCETEQAHAKVLESKAMLLENNRSCDAVRMEPIFLGRGGNVYWKLKCSGNSSILRQSVGEGNSLTLNDKWFALDEDEGKQALEKHICSSRTREKKAKIPK